MTATPNPHFAIPPYQAFQACESSPLWGVANATGFNCLTFPEQPGAVFTSESEANAIASAWNQAAEAKQQAARGAGAL